MISYILAGCGKETEFLENSQSASISQCVTTWAATRAHNELALTTAAALDP